MPEDTEITSGGQEPAEAQGAESTTTVVPEEVRKLREENAKWRTKLRAAEAKLAEAEKTPAVTPDELKALQDKIEQLEDANAKREADLKAQSLALLKQQIGAEFNLPAKLIARLAGEDEDSIRADAQELAEELPKAAATAKTTGMPAGKAQGKTREQQLAEIYGKH